VQAERHLRRVIWAATAVLAGFVALGLFLRQRRIQGVTVSHENGVAVLRDAQGELLLDPWKRPYIYVGPTADHPRARVLSLGADGRPGGEGESADIDSDEMGKEAR
jgi:type II secretory pathway pseudopilin PulG